MKVGKIPQTVLKRSVLKQIQVKREEVILGACVGEDCAALKLQEGEIFLLTTDPIVQIKENMGRIAVHRILNDLAASGAEPVGLLVTVLFPENRKEKELKELMSEISACCTANRVQIIGGHTEVTAAVHLPVLSLSGVGKVKEHEMVTSSKATAGEDIVLTKWIGLEGTVVLAKERQEELLTRYPLPLVETAQDFIRYLSVLKEAACAVKSGISAMHDLSSGGVFGALWEMAESSGVGLSIDLKKIPVKQETIEICEFFEINPYELASGGSLLLAAKDGNALVRNLQKEGIPATIIGKAVSGSDRILWNGEERRFLVPPRGDELYKVMRMSHA